MHFIAILLLLASATNAGPHPNAQPARLVRDSTAPPSGFHALVTNYGIGGRQVAIVGPGATHQLYYISYVYGHKDFDLVAVDPNTGADQVYPGPLVGSGLSEYRANVTIGMDGTLYLGTWPDAHFLQFNPSTESYRDLGAPTTTEDDMLEINTGSDGMIYACTHPNAKLVRYDPVTGLNTDLGSMDTAETYANHCVPGTDGFVYVGIGAIAQRVVAYDIATGAHATIATSTATGFPNVYLAVNGQVYAVLGSTRYLLSNGQAVATTNFSPPVPKNVFSDGRTIAVTDRNGTGNTVTVKSGTQTSTYPYTYSGEPQWIFRLGWGPDGDLYGSSYIPAYLFRLGTNPGTVGWLGCGEVYSFLPYGASLLIAAYDCFWSAPLQIYNPGATYGLGANPALVTFAGQEIAWRPRAMIAGPNGMVYVGARPSYGELGGPMEAWNPASGSVTTYKPVITDESVETLALFNGTIVGGTTIFGGPGITPTQTQSEIFTWDPSTAKVTFQTPVAVKLVTDLIVAPNGLVYGFGNQDPLGHDVLIVFDPAHPSAPQVFPTPALGNAWIVENGIGYSSLAPSTLVALSQTGVIFVDTTTNTVSLVASPSTVTSGFAMQTGSAGDVDVFFGSAATVYEYVYYPPATLRARPAIRPHIHG